MSKDSKESSLAYRKRMMDSISSSFCAAKWYNATIWLDWGHTTSCHHPEAHQIIVRDIIKDPSALHNTIEKKQDREKMLNGERPKGCSYCWTIEDLSENNVSDRVFKTNIYSDDEVKALEKEDPYENIDLKTLEISFNRACNFACSYCGPTFSTKWASDIKRSGPYSNLKDSHSFNYSSHHDDQFPYEDSPVNPYILAFWKWWPKLSQSLQELRVTGGEPMLSQDFWELLRFIKQSGRKDMRFAVNTNLGLSEKYIDRLIEESKHINDFHLYTSCEAVGEQAEYIRDGLDYDQYLKNIEKIIERGNFKSINIMMTINALCLFSLTEFFDQILEWKQKYKANLPTFTLNMLRFPSYMSVLTLPDHIKESMKHKLNNWYLKNKNNTLLLAHEKDGIERLVSYLHKAQRAHDQATDRETAQRDFKVFFEQYNNRRGKSISDIFPEEFSQWYESIKVED